MAKAFTHIDCMNDKPSQGSGASGASGASGSGASGTSGTSGEHTREHAAREHAAREHAAREHTAREHAARNGPGGGFKGLGKLDIRELEAWLNKPASRKDVPLKSEDR